MTVNILVADDASFVRDMVKKHLREHIPGVHILEAGDGNRALAMLKQQPVDLVLSDWEMPGMNGEELLRWVRESERWQDLPFIMVTSRGDRAHVIQAVEAGVSDYLSKPFTPEELLHKVFRQLGVQGKLPSAAVARVGSTQGIAHASVNALTGGARATPAAKARTAVKGRARLRFASDGQFHGCVVRDLSLQAMSGLMQRSETLPGLFDQVVVDIETGPDSLTQINGYVHSLQAGEYKVDTKVIKITVRFVDRDADKFEALSRYIAGL